MDTVMDPVQFPACLHPAAIDCDAGEFSRQGVTAPLDHYRAGDRTWELTTFLDRLVLQQPALFVGGAVDPALERFLPHYDAMESHLPQLRSEMLLDGLGHSAMEERPELVTGLLLAFLASLVLTGSAARRFRHALGEILFQRWNARAKLPGAR